MIGYMILMPTAHIIRRLEARLAMLCKWRMRHLSALHETSRSTLSYGMMEGWPFKLSYTAYVIPLVRCGFLIALFLYCVNFIVPRPTVETSHQSLVDFIESADSILTFADVAILCTDLRLRHIDVKHRFMIFYDVDVSILLHPGYKPRFAAQTKDICHRIARAPNFRGGEF